MSQPLSDPTTALSEFLTPLDVQVVGVAVSGGSDSLALLHLVHEWATSCSVQVVAATVDHGLRPEAAEEAAKVAAICAGLSIDHSTLHWRDHPGGGNLQDAARAARYRLLADWAGEQGVDVMLLGHTQDDLAETFVMRLGRRAGVDGLAAMAPLFKRNGQTFARPLLPVSRAALRALLTTRGVAWVEDPSNDDLSYDRVRIRKALGVLAGAGITPADLAEVSHNMSRVRDALDAQVRALADATVTLDRGDVLISLPPLQTAPAEITRRLFVTALQWVSGAPYSARRAPVHAMLQGLFQGQGGTLQGCLVTVAKGQCRVTREFAAVRDLRVKGPVWDNRWRLNGPWQDGDALRALGEDGIAALPGWRESGQPRASLLASPSVWRGDTLVAAPLAHYNASWDAELLPERAVFLPERAPMGIIALNMPN
ncbi:tRNA lysidine(34) synthetase TilS [Shimia sp. SDUM112013]|uniref:tRNA lysidine(34) synthetase TilS n=1 Tax=Shimia sp. SDUM112013 TaxID=3136160 RepID=UPI0032ECB266